MPRKVRDGSSRRFTLSLSRVRGDEYGKARSTAAQFIVFSMVGAVGTIIQYITMIGFLHLLGVRPLIGSTTGFILGAFANYHLNYRITFHSSRRHRTALPRFYAVALVGLGLNGISMYLLNERLAIHYLLAQVATTAIVVFFNFTGNKLWTFRESAHDGERPLQTRGTGRRESCLAAFPAGAFPGKT